MPIILDCVPFEAQGVGVELAKQLTAAFKVGAVVNRFCIAFLAHKNHCVSVSCPFGPQPSEKRDKGDAFCFRGAFLGTEGMHHAFVLLF